MYFLVCFEYYKCGCLSFYVAPEINLPRPKPNSKNLFRLQSGPDWSFNPRIGKSDIHLQFLLKIRGILSSLKFCISQMC